MGNLTTTTTLDGFIADHIPTNSLLDFTVFVAVDDPGMDLCEAHPECWGRDEHNYTSLVVTHRRPECGTRIYRDSICDCCLTPWLRELRRDGAIDITVHVPTGQGAA